MKRIFSLLLVAAMLFSLAACGNEQTPSTGDTQGAANTTNYDYDPSNLESMLTFITTTGEAACTDTETEAATLIGVLGDSFDSYDANKTEVTAFFENMQARSADLYAAFQSCSIDYFKCVAKQGLDDYDTWDDAMGDFYDAWDDAMGDYYDAWDEAYGDVYNLCDDLISDASDTLDYDDYSDTWSAMYNEYSDAWSAMYKAYSDAWSKTYKDYSACWSGFYKGNTDVDAILAAAAAEDTDDSDDKDEDNGSDETSSGDDNSASDVSYDELEAKIESEVESTLTALATEWETLAEDIDSYESYVAKATEIAAFYDKVHRTSATLCIQMRQYSIDYAKAIMASGKSTDDMYDDLEAFYDLIYDDMGDEIYDGIYDGILDEMYDALYSGALDKRPDGVEYSDWSNARSNEYEMWSDTRSNTYEQWSDFRGDVYEFWSDMRSEMYGDDTEAAQEEIDDFQKDVDKLAGKLDSSEDIPPETTNNTTVANGINPDFKAAMDSYEKFFDEYVIFMKAYQESDDVASMANEYTAMMMQYLETMTVLQEIDEDTLSDEEALYYAEVMLRINQKLLEVA